MTERASSLGFHKLREILISRKFKDQDNVPVAIPTVSALFIGSYGAATNLQALKQSEITHILCVSPTLPLKFPDVFTYLQLPVADQPNGRISIYFDKAFHFIHSALASGGKVLVHCFMGRSRSATIILAYLIAIHDFTLTSALQELRRVRPQAQPNSGFYQELVSLEARHRKEKPKTNLSS
ncbi:dual specificity protein phosphatase 1 isoform 2 [Plasmopara halstedii]|uniref:protein-tyrosine-phosphatase n=1 Tax=Plasmopara halstedii TaxID=4781 RepID=A0A0N7L6U4_PLAHL|nr:dual specificity protein phosphatase 1 isoform 2 [Plasmopara halstedii]CEG45243.1 dual specificity protein phosphatase 1 isoform 2 [Plasmopara halstedii]|eukprot:XP_024581612.1 dual specificity protein phosphatase 1 isoform 2 [Plasmopara halstedii]